MNIDLKNALLLAIFLVLPFLGACKSADTSPVTIKIGSYVFNIPRNYLTDWKDGTSEASGKMNLQLLLPGFEPYNGRNGHEFSGDADRVLTVNVHSLLSEALPTQVYDSFDLAPYLQKKLASGAFEPPHIEASGLTLYRGKAGKDLYSSLKDGRIAFIIECAQAGTVKKPHCEGLRTIFGSLNLYYRYPLHYQAKAELIDKQIEALFTSFMEGEAQEKSVPPQPRVRFVYNDLNIASWQEVERGFLVELTESGSDMLYGLTKENIGRQIDIYVETQLVSSPVVREPIDSRISRLVVAPEIQDEVLNLLPPAKRAIQKR